MTTVLKVGNINEALGAGFALLRSPVGVLQESRNGPVLRATGPIVTEYTHPDERVLFSAVRDANPFFHLMESLWMLAGRNDVEFVKYYAGNMAVFSDDGMTLHGAYGYRWRESMGYDQLPIIIAELKKNQDTRRCVLQMWDAAVDAGNNGDSDLIKAMNGGKDVPCNTHVYFDVVAGRLDMTVCCRSNDMVWGAYGANSVHFSMLMEYVARSASLGLGTYRQFSNNFHIYVDRPDVTKLLLASYAELTDNRYARDSELSERYPVAIMSDGGQEEFDADNEFFFGTWAPGKFAYPAPFASKFFKTVIVPVVNAHHFYKADNFAAAQIALEGCKAWDWRTACSEWLYRREAARAAKGAANV